MAKQLTIEEKLRKEVEYWKSRFEAMEDLKDQIKFCHSIEKQKIKHIETHHPDIFKAARWSLAIAEKSKSMPIISYSELLMLN